MPDWEEAIRKFIDWLQEWFYGYGTKPFNALFWSLGIVIAFFVYWRWVVLGGLRDKTKEKPQGWRAVAGRRHHRNPGR